MIAAGSARASGARHRGWAGIADARAWLAAAGLLLYALLRLAYSTFYQPLGVSPEELGFGYLDILAQAAVGFVVLVVVFAVLAAVTAAELAVLGAILFSAGRAIWEVVKLLVRHQGAARDRDERNVRGETSADVASDENSGGGAVEPDASEQPASTGEAGDGVQQRTAARRTRGAWRVGAGVASIACVLVAGLLILQAAADRRAVERGEPRFPTFAGIRIASWGAHRATVTAAVQNPPREVVALEALCLLYLGTHDGTAFLYDPRARETLRIPSASVLIHIHESGTCGEVNR